MSSLDNEPGAIAYRAHAAGVAAFGVVGLAFMSLALQYQPISRIALFGDAAPVVSGLIMVGLGLALSLTRSRGWGAFLAAAWFGGWVLILHAPRIPWGQLTLGSVLPASEVLVVAVGAALLARWSGPGGRIWRRGWLIAFAVAQIVFGLCHFVYLDITASMIPAIFPAPRAWAILTGVAHLLAAASFLTGVRLRLAARWLCAMYLVFLMMVCVPLAVTRPEVHLHWLMTVITGLHASSAWIVRQRVAG